MKNVGIYIPDVSIEPEQLNKIMNKENLEIFNIMFRIMELDSDLKEELEWKHLLNESETREISMILNKYEFIILDLLRKYHDILHERLGGYEKTEIREALMNHLFYQITQIIGNWTPNPDDW